MIDQYKVSSFKTGQIIKFHEILNVKKPPVSSVIINCMHVSNISAFLFCWLNGEDGVIKEWSQVHVIFESKV